MGNLRALPTDNRDNVAAAGSVIATWWDAVTTDGTFKLISLPSGVEAKTVLIQAIVSTKTDYANAIGFHFSSTGDEDKDFTKHIGELKIDVGLKSGAIGYVRAAASSKIAVMALS